MPRQNIGQSQQVFTHEKLQLCRKKEKLRASWQPVSMATRVETAHLECRYSVSLCLTYKLNQLRGNIDNLRLILHILH